MALIGNQKQTAYEFYELLNKVNNDPKHSNGFFSLLSLPDGNHLNSANSHVINRYSQNPHKLTDMAYNFDKIHGYKRNWFMSINSMRSFKRGKHNIRRFNGFFLDVDCKDEDHNASKNRKHIKTTMPDFMIDGYHQILEKARLPLPTGLVPSGHGFYLFWLMVHGIPNNAPCIDFQWNSIEKKIIDTFNSACKDVLGEALADDNAIDASRVLRIILTTNEKDTSKPRPCLIADFNPNNRYSFRDWHKRFPYTASANKHNHYIGEKKQHHLNHINHKAKHVYKHLHIHHKVHIDKTKHHHNAWTLNCSLIDDLNQYLKDHGYNLHNIDVKRREVFLFIYATIAIKIISGLPYRTYMKVPFMFTKYTIKKVMNNLSQINESFRNPLPTYELNHLENEMSKKIIISHNGFKKNFTYYEYSAKRIIKDLKISPIEQNNMKILISGKVAKHRKHIDYQKHLLVKHFHTYKFRVRNLGKKGSRNILIAFYRFIKHHTYRFIANKVNACKSTVGNIINQLKSQPQVLHRIIRHLNSLHHLSKNMVLYIGKSSSSSGSRIKLMSRLALNNVDDPIVQKHLHTVNDVQKIQENTNKASTVVSSEKDSSKINVTYNLSKSINVNDDKVASYKSLSTKASQANVRANRDSMNANVEPMSHHQDQASKSNSKNYSTDIHKFDNLINLSDLLDHWTYKFDADCSNPFLGVAGIGADESSIRVKHSVTKYRKLAEQIAYRLYKLHGDKYTVVPLNMKSAFKVESDVESPFVESLGNRAVDLVFIKDELNKLIDTYRLPIPYKFSFNNIKGVDCGMASFEYIYTFITLAWAILAVKYPTYNGFNYFKGLCRMIKKFKIFTTNSIYRDIFKNIYSYVSYKLNRTGSHRLANY